MVFDFDDVENGENGVGYEGRGEEGEEVVLELMKLKEEVERGWEGKER